MSQYNIERLPSGSYRVRKSHLKITYTLTFKEKPTKQILDGEFSKLITEPKFSEYRPFKECAENFIKSKDGILKPSSIYSYSKMMNKMSDKFLKLPLQFIKQYDIQILINEYSKDHKFKSVKNYLSFVMGVIKMFLPNAYFRITLPKPIKEERAIPTDEDVKNLFEVIKDTDLEVVIELACFSLRRGEIAALTLDDIDDGKIRINKSLSLGLNGHFILKEPKTYDSTRIVNVPKELTDKIKKQGYIWKLNPARIQKQLSRVQKENNLPHFNLHLFRHYFASVSHMLNVPSAYIQNQGGWSTDTVLKRVYTHPITEKYDNIVSDHFKGLFLAKKGGKKGVKIENK